MTNQNSIQEEIKCRHKAGISCYYSVQTLLFPRVKTYKTVILPVVLYGFQACSLTLWEKSRLSI